MLQEGYRVDGRRATELRTVHCRIGGGQGDGSATFQQGNTVVHASVHGPRETSRRAGGKPLKRNEAVINCEVRESFFHQHAHLTPRWRSTPWLPSARASARHP